MVWCVLYKKTFSELGGETWRIRRFADESDTKWSAFNPSIAYSPEHGYVVMFRSSNYFLDRNFGNAVATTGSRVQSNIWIGQLSDNLEIVDGTMQKVDFSDCGIAFKRGAEDGRLYWRGGGWEFLAGLKEEGIDFPRIGRFMLDSNYKATLVEIMNDGWLRGVEKNWMPPYEVNENFDYVYSPTEVYKSGLGVVEVGDLTAETKGVRGGSCLWKLDDGSYLAIVHKATAEVIERYNPRVFGTQFARLRRYLHCFARYDECGKLIQLTEPFIFENYSVEFAAGLVVKNDDVIVSYGIKDAASALGSIKLNKVLKELKDV